MTMVTPARKTLVQDSFANIATIADDAAVLFYQRLFEIDPSLRRMFPGDMTEQRKKLMQMLTAAVKGLDHLDRLVPVVQDLGRAVRRDAQPAAALPIRSEHAAGAFRSRGLARRSQPERDGGARGRAAAMVAEDLAGD